MNIPNEVKRKGKTRDVVISIRVTSEDRKFMDKNEISPTALFNYALEGIKAMDEIGKTYNPLETLSSKTIKGGYYSGKINKKEMEKLLGKDLTLKKRGKS